MQIVKPFAGINPVPGLVFRSGYLLAVHEGEPCKCLAAPFSLVIRLEGWMLRSVVAVLESLKFHAAPKRHCTFVISTKTLVRVQG